MVDNNTTHPCTKCGNSKDTSCFRIQKDKKSGFKSWCKDCSREYNREYTKARYVPKERKKKVAVDEMTRLRRNKSRHLKSLYGITIETYDDMYSTQEGKCAICKTPKSDMGTQGLYVDHCHDTGKVRGLLCAGCNHSLGVFKDNPTILYAAAKYLHSHGK